MPDPEPAPQTQQGSNEQTPWWKPTKPRILLSVALAVLAFAFVAQINTTRVTNPYETMRRDDLIALLDGMNAESSRLNEELNELRTTRDQLASGAEARELAEAEAERRADTLGILAGTKPAIGPGVRITISAAPNTISADLMIDAIQELRDAGAEVIEINDSVRVVASTWVTDTDGQLTVDDQLLELPVVIDAIGDPHALSEAMTFRGGVVSQVESDRIQGSVNVETPGVIVIDSVRDMSDNEYARPS